MASVASQLIEEVTSHAQRDSLKDAREVCTDGTYFLNNLCTYHALTLLHVFIHFICAVTHQTLHYV
jgi:hypothetical protein